MLRTQMTSHSNSLVFTSMLRDAKVIVTAGTGGVGKTTMAAAIGVAQARHGRRCVVITIDPAKRLAEALGLERLTNDPTRVAVDEVQRGGELWAAMLDTKATFDDVVTREATPDKAEQILANRFYANISGALSGTQEYMAAEKVHQLVTGGQFDVVVIDTPPAANALDFVTAPRRLVRFLDHSLFRLIIAPGRGALRFVSAAAQKVLKPVTNVIGGAVVADAIEFFQLFEGLEHGFRSRAAEALETLSAATTAWVLVTTSATQPLHDALTFSSQIREAGISVRAVILNQSEPVFDDLPGAIPGKSASVKALNQVLVEHRFAIEQDGLAASALRNNLGDIPVVYIPKLGTDVADGAALLTLSTFLG
jgi:anion-transporting  ArsA/GET3 family ATPase